MVLHTAHAATPLTSPHCCTSHWNSATLPFVQLLEEAIKIDDCNLFYVGAHYGVYAAALARKMENGGTIVAVEANRDCYEACKKVVELNGLSNIQVILAAISDRCGRVEFTLGHAISTGDPTQPVTNVDAFTMDHLASEKGDPQIVIVDVEGYECDVLKGAEHVLQTSAHWCIEVHVGAGMEKFGGTLESILDAFPNDRYDLYMARDYGVEPARPFNLSSDLVRE